MEKRATVYEAREQFDEILREVAEAEQLVMEEISAMRAVQPTVVAGVER